MLVFRFINGKSYMEAVAKALLTAKEEIFITDWWLSPEIMMIRPSDDESFRLDNLLGRIAVADLVSIDGPRSCLYLLDRIPVFASM